jgi:precorrin-2 dehydrogenase/sirohydrochlorin ferrochelatase
MRYYPVNLDVRNKNCLVIGAGNVGERKIKGLLRSGANVHVVSPKANAGIQRMASEGLIKLQSRPYQASDLPGMFLVIGATNDEHTNERISQDANNQGILCNIADRPKACSFVLPAIVEQGDLIVAISTSNKSPALARQIRKKLEKELGVEYATLLHLMGAIRNRLLAQGKSPEVHKKKFEKLLDLDLLQLIQKDRIDEIDVHLEKVMGEGYTWSALMHDHHRQACRESP